MPSHRSEFQATRPADLFVVPGDHDLQWDKTTATGRWLGYSNFYGTLPGSWIDPDHPERPSRVIDQSADGLIVAEINSCADIQREVEIRGQIDPRAIAWLRDKLDKIPSDARDRAIKVVAVVHHHPVHLPGLAGSSEGYSALVNSNRLLERLREFGFHVILHGHKHTPFTFWYDPACAWIAIRRIR